MTLNPAGKKQMKKKSNLTPHTTQSSKKRISIIGSGNVATHLAKALYHAGHKIDQIWSREYDHADALAFQVMAEPINKLELLHDDCDVYILAVHDDALFDLSLDLKLRESLVLHTSGTVGMSVLKPISRKCGVIWSPQSFVREVEMDYSALPFCIEASSDATEREICELLRPVSEHIFILDGEQRKWTHLASVMVNNFGNALNAIAQDQLKEHGIPFEILHPLIKITAEKIEKSKDLWRLQTGPAVRKDQKTIDAHRKMLAEQPELLKLYEIMTDFIDHGTH